MDAGGHERTEANTMWCPGAESYATTDTTNPCLSLAWWRECLARSRARMARAVPGQFAREEETQHFPCRVWPSRIGVGAGGTAARPGVAGAMNVPVFGDHPAALVGNDGASVGMPVGHPSAKHLRCWTRRFGGLLENAVAVV